MEKNDRWDLWERMPWFKFEGQDGARKFENISSLEKDSAAATVALRALKYQLENELCQEISDDLFCEIFRKVCGFRPIPAFGGMAILGLIQPLQRTLEIHGVDKNKLGAILRTFRANIDNPRYYDHLFLHIPHSSTIFPANSKHSFNDLNEEERLLIDYYTDELFLPDKEEERIHSIVFPFCRLYCDVERMIKDPLEVKGFGICYNRLRPIPARSFYESDYLAVYLDYHTASVKKIGEACKSRLLIDCHSFSAKPTLLNPSPSDIDLCIGFNEDETKPNNVVIGNIEQYFKSLGYKVGINTPFSNSKTFPLEREYKSVMIEVNKRLYMNESTLEKTEGFARLHGEIQNLYKKLLIHR